MKKSNLLKSTRKMLTNVNSREYSLTQINMQCNSSRIAQHLIT